MGTEIFKHLAVNSFQLLRPQGLFLSEIGSDQEIAAKEILMKSGFQSVEVLRDYAGHPRIAKGIK